MQNLNDSSFGHIDLRALRFLAKVLEQRSVTHAGEEMGLSQPAASRLLAQIRHAFGDDPLLVRTVRGGYVPTARATELMPLLAEAIAAENRLFARPEFDPSCSTRSFRVATTDYGAAIVVTKLVCALAKEAPGVSVDVRAWDSGTLTGMEEGRIDLALYTDEALPTGFHFERLFEEQFCCIVRSGHPVLANRDADGRIGPSLLAELPRVVLLYPEGSDIAADDPLSMHGRRHGPGDFLTPYFLAGPLLVSQSDHVLCMARRIAELVAAKTDVTLIDFPDAGQMRYCAIWHERAASDPGAAWMRRRLADLAY
ncbi:LysR family transcriptional regulator [Variovorax paradoxus]|uniref:LysR family transcriptional regulator n=1 Tax=Variovorax paradoxus TaxID=34073 RepID=UPI001931D652|nr:LysR family transcriptional regulator [Variovorax paradoxus]